MVRISNLELIKLLRENARITFVELARRLNVSETAIRKRIKKLEEQGIIKKYTVEVDPKRLGFEVNVLVGIDTNPEDYIQTLERLKKMKEVINLYSSSGDHMILVECWFKNYEELMEFVKKLRKMRGITRICPAVILKRIK